MSTETLEEGRAVFLGKPQLGDLVDGLRAAGYTVVAPVEERGTIVLRAITSARQLARGRIDEQDGGHYRLLDGDADQFFQYVVGPDSARRWLWPPVQKLLSLTVHGQGFDVQEPARPSRPLALLGIRPCDLASIQVLDRVFDYGPAGDGDPAYAAHRRNLLTIVVNCNRPGGTCFCDSMGTGPAAGKGYDLALTELRGGFLVHIGSGRGAAALAGVAVRPPSEAEVELADVRMEQARKQMGRRLHVDDLKRVLDRAIDHPRWDDVAKRCMACGNCTMVCPTCFCTTMVDGNDLAGATFERTRVWESCFTHQFTYTTAGPVRSTIRGRYRQWLRHKLGTWHDQFGVSGCVGCGRCITWCPVGIDLTEEAAALAGARESEVAS